MALHIKNIIRHYIVIARGISLVPLLLVSLMGSMIVSSQTFAGNTPNPIDVFVSILPQKYFVQQVGGDRIKVNVMVGPGQSPETYEPSPTQLEKLSHSVFYFRMGVPFENSWLDKIKSLYPSLKIIDARKGITLRNMNEDYILLEPVSGALQNMGMKDPHIWTNPMNVVIFMKNFSDTLSNEFPQDKSFFEGNYRRMVAQLNGLDQKIKILFKPVQKKFLLVYHPSWGYFAQQYGLAQIPIEVEGKPPNAKSLAKIIKFARQNKLRVIFTQTQFSQRNARTVADAIGGETMAVDPLAEDYLTNLFYVAQQFARSMQ